MMVPFSEVLARGTQQIYVNPRNVAYIESGKLNGFETTVIYFACVGADGNAVSMPFLHVSESLLTVHEKLSGR